jgi:hypothetical protein
MFLYEYVVLCSVEWTDVVALSNDDGPRWILKISIVCYFRPMLPMLIPLNLKLTPGEEVTSSPSFLDCKPKENVPFSWVAGATQERP